MTTTKVFLKAIEQYAELQKLDIEQLFQKLDDEQFKLVFYAVAELFTKLRNEAVRRGIWDEIKTKKIQ